MTRVFFVAVVAIAVAAAVFAGARQEPVFRADTRMVSVYATVVDQQGRPVPNLTKDDFEVFDNGTRQTTTVFANDLQPITIVVMLDRSDSMAHNFDLERHAAEQFVINLQPNDKARLGSFSKRVQIDPPDFTSDKNELIRILHENLQDAGPTPLWHATTEAMGALAHENGRRVVLVFTDGKDYTETPELMTSLTDVRDRAEADGIMLYAIGLSDDCAPIVEGPRAHVELIGFQRRGGGGRGPTRPLPGRGIPGRGGPGRGVPVLPGVPGRILPGRDGEEDGPRRPCDSAKPDPGLKTLASEGGGAYFELQGTEDLASTFARVADELHHQYMLAFMAPALDGTLHSLSVHMRQPDLTARARKSYLAAPVK